MRLWLLTLSLVLFGAPVFGDSPTGNAVGRGSYSAVATGSSTTATCDKPASTIEDDLMILGLRVDTGNTVTPPSGWTTGPSTGDVSSGNLTLYYKVTTDGDLATANYAFTLSPSSAWTCAVGAYINALPSAPINGSGTVGNTTAGTSLSVASQSVTPFNGLAVRFAINSAGGTWTPPGSYNERIDSGGLQIADRFMSALTTTGASVSTASTSGNLWGAQLVLNRNTGAVRLYFDRAAVPSISPAFSADWEETGEAVRRIMYANKGEGSLTTLAASESSASAQRDVLVVQYVACGLAATTISGAVKMQMRALSSSATADPISQFILRVFDSTGATEQAVLVAGTTDTGTTNEWATAGTGTNRRFPRLGDTRSIASFTPTAGDCLVAEVGWRAQNASATTFTGTLVVDPADLAGTTSLMAEDDTSGSTNYPWIEFSRGLTFVQGRKKMSTLGVH